MGITFSQFFPPAPTLTEHNLPSQSGKIVLITGGYSGVGYELANILYNAGAKVYIAGRSKEKAFQAIEFIKSSSLNKTSAGELHYHFVDLSDLSTIKPSTEEFKSKEQKLDVLWNNAAISNPPAGSITKQGHDLQLATNCLGPYLFTQLLLPSLQTAVKSSATNSVRVVWTSSFVVDLAAPKGGFKMTDLMSPSNKLNKTYVDSKTANWFLASELARQVGPSQAILSVTQNPGNLRTNLLRHVSWMGIVFAPLLYPAKMGAYTELWAGLSPELTIEANGAYVIPWGRIHPAPRGDLLDALNVKEEGGTGLAGDVREWCERETNEYR